MKVKTSSGFACDIPEGLANDFRFLKAHRALKSDDRNKSDQAAVDLVSIVFCDEATEERFFEHLADEHGRVPIATVYQELGEILTQAAGKSKKVKNS